MKRFVWITLMMLATMGATASAQSRGSYFFENSLLRSKLNPAFAPKNDYASLFGVGSLSVDMASNVGLKNFIFREGDVSHLFLSDAVDADKFISKLPRHDPYLNKRVESDLFGVGMRLSPEGYATLSLSLVENGSYELPGSMLRYVKAGNSTDGSAMGGGSVSIASYAAISAGYSHDLSQYLEGLRAGVRIKLLVGLAAGHFNVDKLGVRTGTDQIQATVHGTGNLSGIGYSPIDGFSVLSPNLRSLGAAIDLGVSYRFPMDGLWMIEGIELSASLCDLGGLKYNNSVSSLLLDHQFDFTGIGDLTSDVSASVEQTIEDLKTFTQIDPSQGEPFFYRLPASVHIGATAHLLQEKANVGLLFYHAVGQRNVMLAGGYSPYEWLNLGVNWTFLGPANRVGFYAEFIPRKYVGMFFGMECASLTANKKHIPVRNFTESIAFGVNILFE